MIKVFKAQHNTLQEINRILDNIAKAVKPSGDDEYVRLFCQDAEILVDNIALNVLKRPDEPLFTGIMQELDRKINLAIAAKFPTKYNLCVSASVVVRKNATYILISSEGDFCKKALEDLEYKELRKKDATELLQSDAPIMFSKQLYPAGNIDIPDSKMAFTSAEERAAKLARHNVQSDLLKCIASGKEIQNYQLNEYFDQVFELMGKDAIKLEMSNAKMRLQTILPEITPDLIKLSPQELAFKAQQQAKAKQDCSCEYNNNGSSESE